MWVNTAQKNKKTRGSPKPVLLTLSFIQFIICSIKSRFWAIKIGLYSKKIKNFWSLVPFDILKSKVITKSVEHIPERNSMKKNAHKWDLQKTIGSVAWACVADLSFCFEETLYITFHRCFLPNFCSFGYSFQKRRFFRNWPIGKKNCL